MADQQFLGKTIPWLQYEDLKIKFEKNILRFTELYDE